MKKVIFCTKKDDDLGLIAVETLKQLGCNVLSLELGESAPKGSIAFFTPEDGSSINWKKWLKIAIPKFNDVIPFWAQTTSYCVALRPRKEIPEKDSIDLERYEKAILSVAIQYENLLTGSDYLQLKAPVPEEKFEKTEKLQEIIEELRKDQKLRKHERKKRQKNSRRNRYRYQAINHQIY